MKSSSRKLLMISFQNGEKIAAYVLLISGASYGSPKSNQKMDKEIFRFTRQVQNSAHNWFFLLLEFVFKDFFGYIFTVSMKNY